MQPALSGLPIELSSHVPWIPYPFTSGVVPVARKAIHLVPSMLFVEPKGISGSPGLHHGGSLTLSSTTNVPIGVLPNFPVPTEYLLKNALFMESTRSFLPLFTAIENFPVKTLT
jgi:hypothetical protein